MDDLVIRGAGDRHAVEALLERLDRSEPIVRFQSFGFEASTLGSVRSEERMVGPVAIRVSCRSVSLIDVLIDLTGCPGTGVGDVVPVTVFGAEPRPVIVPVVVRDDFRSAELQVTVPPVGWEVHVVDGWCSADGLGELDPAGIEASVPLTNHAGRVAWQEIAAARPEGEVVRQCIERGLAR